MAAKQLVKKDRSVTYNVDYTKVGKDFFKEIRTTCPTFGACILDAKLNLDGACLQCKQTPEVKEACLVHSPATDGISSAKVKGTRKEGSGRVGKTPVNPFDDSLFPFVQMFKEGKTAESVKKAIVDSNRYSESSAKTLNGKLSCVCGAILRPNFKDSTVYQVIRYNLFDSKIEPVGDKSSIDYVTRICNIWKVA
jgi:hypothetical protein